MIFIILTRFFGGYWGIRTKILNSRFLVKKLYRFILMGYLHEKGAYLPVECEISGPVNFIHGGYGVFISKGAKIGENCTIFQHVTIGSNALIDSKGFGSPTIGDNCLIGAGAKIIGNITIGKNCRIGANCIVTENIPDNSLVVLGKPTIITKDKIVNRIYQESKDGIGYKENGKFIIENDTEIIKKFHLENPKNNA